MNLKKYIARKIIMEIKDQISDELEQTIENLKDNILILEDQIDDLFNRLEKLEKEKRELK